MPRGRPRLVPLQVASGEGDAFVADYLAAKEAEDLHQIEATVPDDLHLGDGRVILDRERAHVPASLADDLIAQGKARRV